MYQVLEHGSCLLSAVPSFQADFFVIQGEQFADEPTGHGDVYYARLNPDDDRQDVLEGNGHNYPSWLCGVSPTITVV